MSNQHLHRELAARNNAYLLGIRGAQGLTTEVVDIYDDVLIATDESQRIIERIADVATHIITLTVTEKGYYLRAADAGLDMTAEPIQQDLNTNKPATAIGLLAAGLRTRRLQGGGPVTIMSCDNLAQNGAKLQRAMLDFLAVYDASTASWLTDNATFPSSMVDRITPRLNRAAVTEIESCASDTGFSVVGTEAFSEWVIEDKFAGSQPGSRPDWESAGAVIVPRVTSFEERKLRMLNAAHSYLAYAGLLAGYSYVHEAISDEGMRQGVLGLWDEAASTISAPASKSIAGYQTALLDRFSVPDMRHQLSQIAMDGSLKLRERITPIVLERRAAGLRCPGVLEVVRVWQEFVADTLKSEGQLVDQYAAEIDQNNQNSDKLNDFLLALIGLSRN